jgi:lipid-A-disaccharide synthase
MNVFWVVGESSGDRHAAHLIRELTSTAPGWSHAGMGGEAMKNAGCELAADLSEVSMMGLTEVVRHLPRLLRLQKRLVEEIESRKVDLVVLVDLPDFNLSLGSRLRKKFGDSLQLFYYVSPQVWAWRKGRAKGIAKLVDAMAVLFPFEVDAYEKYGLETVFFGHPLAGKVAPSKPVPELRNDFSLAEEEEAVAVLPGSRAQEVERLLPVQLEAVEKLREQLRTPVRILVARAGTVSHSMLEAMTAEYANTDIVDEATYDALAVSRTALVKSGTSTIEAAMIGTPFVVLYKVSNLTYRLARLLVRGVKHIAMVNVLADREVVRERIQDEARPELLASDLFDVWDGPERLKVQRGLEEVAASLGKPGATRRLASWMVSKFGESK